MLDSAIPCPIEYCIFIAASTSNLIEHLRHIHNNGVDGMILRRLAILAEYYCVYKQKHEKINWKKMRVRRSEFYECYE